MLEAQGVKKVWKSFTSDKLGTLTHGPMSKMRAFVGRLTCFPIKNGDVSLGNVYLRVFGNTSNSKVPHFRKTPGGYFEGLIMFGHFGVLKR